MSTPVLATAIPTAATWTDLGAAVGVSKVQALKVRAINVSGGDANAKVRLKNGATIINRIPTYPIPAAIADSVVDFEDKTPISTGWIFQVWSSVNAALEFTLTGWEDDA